MTMEQEYSSPSIYESEYGGYTGDFDICGAVAKGEALTLKLDGGFIEK